MTRKRKTAVISWMVIAALLFSGCGKKSDTSVENPGLETESVFQSKQEGESGSRDVSGTAGGETAGRTEKNKQTEKTKQTETGKQTEEASQTENSTGRESGIEAEDSESGQQEIGREITVSDNVNLREAPSTDASIYQIIQKGSKLYCIWANEKWCKVSYDDRELYAAAEYMDLTEEAAAENGYKVTIDPGHSSVVAEGTDPIGPGASEQKAKDSGGTTGCVTGIREYELNLQVSIKLREELESRGYQVFMTRESNEVPVGNVERAGVANDSGSDILVRIHANGSEDSSISGGMTICPTAENPYIGSLYEDSRRLSDCILQHLLSGTGRSEGWVWETDTMTGNNWSQVPVTIVEMGYMTNPEEDQNMASEEYQERMAVGIADGIDAYFEGE